MTKQKRVFTAFFIFTPLPAHQGPGYTPSQHTQGTAARGTYRLHRGTHTSPLRPRDKRREGEEGLREGADGGRRVSGGRRDEGASGRGRHGGRGRRGQEGRVDGAGVGDARPAADDGLGEAAADGMADGHADEGGEARDRPRGAVKEGGGDAVASAPTEVGKEAQRRGAERAKDADGDDDEAHAGRQGTVLGADAVARDGVVGGVTGAVGVVGGAVGGAGGVEGLDVHQAVRPGAVETDDDSVRAVLEGSPRPLHELVEGHATAGTLGDHGVGTEERIEAGDQGIEGGVVAGGGEAEAVGTLDEVAVEAGDGTRGGRTVARPISMAAIS